MIRDDQGPTFGQRAWVVLLMAWHVGGRQAWRLAKAMRVLAKQERLAKRLSEGGR